MCLLYLCMHTYSWLAPLQILVACVCGFLPNNHRHYECPHGDRIHDDVTRHNILLYFIQ